jgi:hypothetical protein
MKYRTLNIPLPNLPRPVQVNYTTAPSSLNPTDIDIDIKSVIYGQVDVLPVIRGLEDFDSIEELVTKDAYEHLTSSLPIAV